LLEGRIQEKENTLDYEMMIMKRPARFGNNSLFSHEREKTA